MTEGECPCDKVGSSHADEDEFAKCLPSDGVWWLILCRSLQADEPLDDRLHKPASVVHWKSMCLLHTPFTFAIVHMCTLNFAASVGAAPKDPGLS